MFIRIISLITGFLVLYGCDAPSSNTPSGNDADANTNTVIQLDASLLSQWGRSCGLCHINGEGGAPRVGNSDDWRTRSAQGQTVLLDHTIEGFNKMPPLGYCMSCSRDDFTKLIEFMSGVSR